ncbi:MAG TPA: hypothetical protein VME47_02635 [Acetobacteraceae bacterium]|nr:hypothetical protein [Acetobacteraceae bacterium]
MNSRLGNLSREAGEVEVRSTEGEGDRVGTYEIDRADYPAKPTMDFASEDKDSARAYLTGIASSLRFSQ